MSNKYKILNSNVSANTHEFLVDEIADIRFLPAESGSTAIVAENSDVYICNNTKQWVKFDSINGEETVFPSGKITITENGTDIDIAQYATADVNVVGNGVSFGEVQQGPKAVNAIPSVGDRMLFDPLAISGIYTTKPSSIQDTSFILAGFESEGSEWPTLSYGVEGLYIMSKWYLLDDIDTIDAYVCELEYPVNEPPIITSVTLWDGQIDIFQMSYNFFHFGFTMPNFGEKNYPSKALVFHIYKK